MPDGAELTVGGLTPLSTVDWPDVLAAVVFCQGCAWACPYCHNPGLRDRAGPGERSFAAVLSWLEERTGLLDGVVFSGGEPTLQAGLPKAMAQVRSLGFQVGLHTAGMVPRTLAAALPLTDWVGLDIKAPLRSYARVTGAAASGPAAWASLALLARSGRAFEVRTTWHPGLLSDAEMLALARELARTGVAHWRIQPFQPKGCADAALAQGGPAVFPASLAERLQAALPPGLSLLVRS